MSPHADSAWHNSDDFWALFEEILFSPGRLAAAQAEVDQISSLLSIGDGARILDLPCGVGRHALEFAQHGHVVVGIDRTARYIERARAEASRRTLDVTFEVGDMRAVCMPDTFDVVLNLFGSFGYFEQPEDDRTVVEHMYASLRPGGQFLIETMGKEILARDFRARDWSEEGDLLLLSERTIREHWSRVDTRWIVIRGTERFEHRVSVHSYSAAELSALLAGRGFGDIRVYGSLEGIPYDHAAQRLVVIGRKLS